MGLLTKPSALTSASRALYSWLNSRVDDLYNIIGTTLNGRGSLNYLNLSATADLAPGQGRGTFLTLTDPDTLGTQTVTRTTVFTALTVTGGDALDTTTTGRDSIAISNNATTFALAQPGRRFQNLTYAVGMTNNANITTVTGATVGRVYTFLGTNLDDDRHIILTHTDTNTADSFKMKGIVDTAAVGAYDKKLSATVGTPEICALGTYVYGDLNGSGVNQFWEL